MKELKKISADKIDHQDKRFIISDGPLRSRHELPLFYQEAERFIPLKKYDINENEIDAFVYGSEMTYSEIIKELIIDTELTMFDQALIMEKLDTYEPQVDKNEWSKRFRINIGKWDEVKTLATYDKAWQNYFVDKKTPLKRIMHFSSEKVRECLLPLLELNPGINVLESIAKLLSETAHAQKSELTGIWRELSLPDILERHDIASPIKLKMIKDRLYAKRYPTIARYRKDLDEHLKTIPHAAGVDLHSDENFETPGMRLTADLRSKQDIEEFQMWLKEHQHEFEKIIDIQKGQIENE